jgi:predicted nucleotidyltransferase
MLVAALGIFHANVRRAAQAVVILTKGKMNTDSNDLQQNIIRKLTTLLKKENIVAALFLKGSIARGTADRYSDIDYYCLIHKNSMQEIMDKRKKIVTSIGKIIYLEEVNFGNPQLIVIYDNEVHLDLYLIMKCLLLERMLSRSYMIQWESQHPINEWTYFHLKFRYHRVYK